LKQGMFGAMAAGVTLGLTDTIAARSRLSLTSPRNLDRAAFQAQLNTSFLFRAKSSKTAVKLVEVTDFGSRKSAHGHREAFSLVFSGDNESPLNQNTYTIEHQELGKFSFLVVPIMSRDKSVRYYEAFINRLHG
jgi:hypothetical protein